MRAVAVAVIIAPSLVLLLALPLQGAVALSPLAPRPHQAEERPPELVPVPTPKLDGLDPAVVEELASIGALISGASLREANPTELAALFGEVGKVYLAHRFYRAAEAALRNAETVAPGDYRWPYLTGYLHGQQGQHAAALAAYRRALRLRPDYQAARIRAARLLHALNRPEEADDLLAELPGYPEPESPAALELLGQLALSRGDSEAAVAYLQEALARAPQADSLHYQLALAYRASGDVENARAHLARRGTVGLRPDDPLVEQMETLVLGERLYLLRGQAAFRAGQYDAAVDAFSRAVEAGPDSVRARVNLGSALGSMGRTEEAIAQFREVLRIEPADLTAHYNLGQLLLAADQPGPAIVHLQTVREQDPDDRDTLLALGRALGMLGRQSESVEALERAVSLDPEDTPAAVELAAAHLGAGRCASARAVLEERAGGSRSSLEAAHALAHLLAGCPDLAQRDGERALELATAAFDASPTLARAQTVAMALAELDRCEEATEWQERALEAGSGRLASDDLGRLALVLHHYRTSRPCRYAFPIDLPRR